MVRFEIHMEHLGNPGEGPHRIARYITPDGDIVEFDDEKGMIDFSKLIPYVGRTFRFIKDGKFHKKCKLTKADEKMIHFEEVI
jgi:hypothetical protein